MTTVSGNGDKRTDQKFTQPQHHIKRYSFNELDGTGFSGILLRSPPPVSPALLRKLDFKDVGVGKVKVILKISNPVCPSSSADTDWYNSFLTLDKRKKQVTLTDPSLGNGLTPEDRRLGILAPKMFAFDAIFSQEDSQTEICSGVLTDVVHAVINGTDGCLFSFGQVGLGKSYTMLGSPESTNTLGIIPCAISWLFKGISEQKQKTGARFSVRVSAVEVGGPTNQLNDLLVGYSNDSEQSPGVYLQDDQLFTNQPHPHCELRVPTAEKAAFYLDAALECRSVFKEEIKDSHFLFTLHIYQYSVAGKGGVAGGRSRLHLIDLGNSDRSKASGGISSSGVGNIILAILNGQKHLPYKEHNLTRLLKECLGPSTCHATMIAHVSPFAQNYLDTLTTVQLASRIHRMRKRRIKFGSTSLSNSSGGSSGEDVSRTGTSSEPDPSSSDLSADTVIYVGRAEEATDGEHPPVYIPSLNSGDNRCSMSKILKGSIAEHKLTQTSKPPRVIEKPRSSQNHRHSTHSGSSRSSPFRKESNKSPKYSSNDRSDEQWIDGPRISKSKIAEAFQLMKEKYRVRKFETWIDGPMKEEIDSTYGYMDSHKKNMIKKWVEHQSVQMQKTKSDSPKLGIVQKGSLSETSCGLKVVENLNKKQKLMEKLSKVKGTSTDEDNEDEDEPELPPALPLIQPLSSREVSIESLDQILRERMISATEYQENCSVEDNDDDDYDVLELIEVEEPLEPVPMQDKCLQVTEEDIILCIGKSENPLPEVDQQSAFRDSLKILSEESLSAISSFTDSIAVLNDLEKILPRYLDLNGYYNDYEDIDNTTEQGDEECLHKLYCTGFENTETAKHNPVLKSYNSMSLSDILFSQQKLRTDESSIYSEPIYLRERFCENCKANMYRPHAASNEYINSMFFNYPQNQVDIGGRFQSYNHKKELSELRQPDGASNPNLEDDSGRLPANGARFSEYKSSSFSPLDNRSTLNFETGIAAIKFKHKSKKLNKPDDYDRTSKHSPGTKAESLSLNDSVPSEISHSRKCKHNHSKSFCSWLLNPFTCKYVHEPRETHL